MSSGRTIQPSSKDTSHFTFNGLAANTRHSIEVTFTYGMTVNTVSGEYTTTLGSLRKFPQ